MTNNDKGLGMDRQITRRDFLNGAAVISASSLIPSKANAKLLNLAEYPPLRTGLRGSHPGSIEVAHQLGLYGRTNWNPIRQAETDEYDLVVVGAGISGLSAAHFYRKAHPGARILILDNHDDFGGHAKRNEFELDNRMFLGHGGSQTLQEPSEFSAVCHELLKDLRVDLGELKGFFDQSFYHRHDLTDSTYFDRKTYGVDRIVRYPLAAYSNFLPLQPIPLSPKEAVAQMPLTDSAKHELQRLLEFNTDQIKDVPADKQLAYLYTLSYRELLNKHLDVNDPELMNMFQGLTKDMSVSIEKASAMGSAGYLGLPGLNGTSLNGYKALSEPYLHHFPDGNATVARLLVRNMIPDVCEEKGMQDIVSARFDYSKLDTAGAIVRLRLNSTAVQVVHDGPVNSAKRVEVVYVQGGKSFRIRSKSCILAGYNSMIRHICPELPKPQKEALSLSAKTPIFYTNVLLRNWHAWKNLGIGCSSAPGGYYSVAYLDYPVNIGSYQHAKSPDEPIVVHMERFPKGDNPNASAADQLRAGRHEMFSSSYNSIERETRAQLAGMLSPGGFDPAKDIAAITVNRWGHGYARRAQEGEYSDDNWPHIVGRKSLGRISIANSDAGASASIDAAIDQAYRAVGELS